MGKISSKRTWYEIIRDSIKVIISGGLLLPVFSDDVTQTVFVAFIILFVFVIILEVLKIFINKKDNEPEQ
jgi:hypothetical protein